MLESDGQKVFIGFGPVFISDEFDKFKCDKGEWKAGRVNGEKCLLVLLLTMHPVYVTPENIW